MMALLYRLACLICMGLAMLVFAVLGFWDLLCLTLACLVAAWAAAGRLGARDGD